MPPLYVLNPPANPFWDFVSGLEDHPFFTGPPGHAHPHGPPPSDAPRENAWASKGRDQAAEPEMSEKAQGKQATVEDPPEVDPATVQPETSKSADAKDRFRRRGRWAREGESGEEGERRCRGGFGRGARGRPGWGGPPPFGPFWGQPPFQGQPHGLGGPPHHGPHHGPPHGPPHGGHHGRHGPPMHDRGHHGRCSPPRQRPGFDLSEFLNKLGEKLGVDLAGAAENFGLSADRFSAVKTGQDVDFEPRSDIFENKDLYTVHLSLPGAKKSDIGVDYDGEHSVLRVTGVVHRPDADEQMISELVVDGRKRETGVFEKAIRLGTKRDPANIDVAGISAKMIDGVLVVKIPKVEKITEKREVPISTDPLDAGQADYEDEYSEKPILFDAEEQASVAGIDISSAPRKGPISLIDQEHDEETKKPSKKAEEDINTAEPTAPEGEQLPSYSPAAAREEEDWENFSDASGEAEYVKIDVK